MGYLICDKCKNYYELQHGEKPEDFDLKCGCGGTLKYAKNIDITKPNQKQGKKRSKSTKNYNKEILVLRELIEKISGSIKLFPVSIGLVFSVIVLILSSIIFGILMLTGLFGIIIYTILTLISMALFGSFITGLLGCHHIDEGAINGGFLTLILLITIGLILGFTMFIAIGIFASIMSSLGPLASSTGASSSSGNSALSSFSSLLNIFYAIIAIILSLLAGVGGGSLGVITKKKLKIPL